MFSGLEGVQKNFLSVWGGYKPSGAEGCYIDIKS